MSSADETQDKAKIAAAKAMTLRAFSELAQAKAELNALKQSRSWKITTAYRWLGERIKGTAAPISKTQYDGKDLSSAYYQSLHDTHPAYQQNNWLIEERERLLRCKPSTILEIGCGNGKFLRDVAAQVESVIGVDWAISPLTTDLPPNAKVVKADIVKDTVPSADLVCSADVLEHFHPDNVDAVIRKLHQAGRHNYHVIACYDDLHSHLTIISPGEWLYLFQKMSSSYRLLEIRARNNNPIYPVCVIANF